MRLHIKRLAVLALFPLLTACGVLGPPSARDNESYDMLKMAKPQVFANAAVISSWRGFTTIGDTSGDGSEQCAMFVYDLKTAPATEFISRIEIAKPPYDYPYGDPRIGWYRSGWVEEKNSDGYVDETYAMVTRPDYQPFPANDTFCDMPKDKYQPLSQKINELWKRPETPLFALKKDYGGGVGWSGDRVYREIFGLIDLENQKLYMWLKVSPSSRI